MRSLSLAALLALASTQAFAAGTVVNATNGTGTALSFYTLPANTANIGTLYASGNTLFEFSSLNPGSNAYNYAYTVFVPSETGAYTVGMMAANFDPVMIVYGGVTAVPVNASTNVLGMNDDIAWIPDTNANMLAPFNTYLAATYGASYQVTGGNAAGRAVWMPYLDNLSLVAGQSYLLAISTYAPNTTIVLPATFYVEGAGVVAFEPIPEPSTYGLVLGGLALAVVAVRRRKSKGD